MMLNQTRTTLGFYLSGVDLEQLTGDLQRDGIRQHNVGVILPAIHPISQVLRNLKEGKLGSGEMLAVEESLGWVMKFGVVIIPHVGLFISGKDFAGTLFGAGVRKRTCSGTLQALGIAPIHAKRCEEWVEGDGVVVFVAGDRESATLAQSDMEESGAEGVWNRAVSTGTENPAIC